MTIIIKRSDLNEINALTKARDDLKEKLRLLELDEGNNLSSFALTIAAVDDNAIVKNVVMTSRDDDPANELIVALAKVVIKELKLQLEGVTDSLAGYGISFAEDKETADAE